MCPLVASVVGGGAGAGWRPGGPWGWILRNLKRKVVSLVLASGQDTFLVCGRGARRAEYGKESLVLSYVSQRGHWGIELNSSFASQSHDPRNNTQA